MYKNKTIGIWGLGKVGISAMNFLQNEGARIIIMDRKNPDTWYGQAYYKEEEKEKFFHDADYILASPGIDIRPYYHHYKNKWITELDLFYSYWKKPIIAITGSVGKTTVTHLLGQLLQRYGTQVAVCGNIGTPMLDMVCAQGEYDCALLEVSSFQLEYCTQFAPDLSIWTNFSPNHLDRHTLEEYFIAKTKICAFQNDAQFAIIPYSVYHQIKGLMPLKKWRIICDDSISKDEVNKLKQEGNTLYLIEVNSIIKTSMAGDNNLIALEKIPSITFASNWITIGAALDTLRYNLEELPSYASSLILPDHRMEKITVGSFTFYNDSKATTIKSTIAAVGKCNKKKPILFLGGLSKGVNRSDLINQIQGKVKRVICFGKEQETLSTFCKEFNIPSTGHQALEDAFAECIQHLEEGDEVLFSPSGSSYDLFKDYEERGNQFKKLVASFAKSYCKD